MSISKSRRHNISTQGKKKSRGQLRFESLENRICLAATVHIDSAWISQQGAGPYALSASDTTYVLDLNISTSGTAFVFAGKNVTLDLNGHTVTYDNITPSTVANGGFESGTLANWNTSSAPHASVVNNTAHLYGGKMLQFSGVSGTESITSDTISIPKANQEYTATITPGGCSGTVTLSVLDAVTGATLATKSMSDFSYRSVISASFMPSNTNGVKLKISTTGNAVLDYASVSASRQFGVVVGRDQLPSQLSYVSGLGAVANATITDSLGTGAINQGQGAGWASPMFYADSVQGLTISNLHGSVNGQDTNIVHSNWGSNFNIHDNTFTSTSDNVSLRDRIDISGGAMLSVSNSSGTITIKHNSLIGSPQQGVFVCNTNSSGNKIYIQDNTIQSKNIVANGYGIELNTAYNFVISGNNITAGANGSSRGIIIDNMDANGEIYNNYVDIHEQLNREYSDPAIGQPSAFKVRTWSDGDQHDIYVHDNTFIARTYTGEFNGAVGFRYELQYNTNNSNLNYRIENNTFSAYNQNSNSAAYAVGVSLENVRENCSANFKNNVFDSNQMSLGLGGDDGYQAYDGNFISNTFRKTTIGTSVPYYSVAASPNLYGEAKNIQLIDSRYEGGATPDIYFKGYEYPKDITVGWFLSVQAQSTTGASLAGATVKVLDKNGAQVFSVTADSSGLVKDISLLSTTYQQTSSSATSISTTQKGPFTVQVSLSGYTSASQTVTLDKSQTATVQLSPTNSTAGVLINQSGGSTNVAEGGATDSYTVTLASQPTSNVTVTVSPNGQLSTDKTTLTFTSSNWNVPQTVTVSAVDDTAVEGTHTGSITHTATSSDAKYNGLSVAGVTAQITDNDTAPNAGVQITPSGSSTNVAEGGATDNYTVVLTSAPTSNVTVTVSPNGQLSTDKTTLTFTSSNWNVPQTVTVSAVDDTAVEGTHSGAITHQVASSDANYNGLSIAGVTAQITDNDTAPPTTTSSDTTLADFQKGTADSGIQLTDNSGGTVTLATTAGSEFSGSALPSGWTSTAWNTGGASTLTNGVLQVNGAKAYSNTTYSAGRSIEFRATFQSDGYQHAGFGTDLNAAPWAIFSTGSGGGLNVRTNNGTSNLSTPISSSFLGSPHNYRIDWNGSNVTYYVDGTVVATHTVAISTAMRPIVSDYATGGNNLQVDYLHMGPVASAGSFTSRVFDGGNNATWDKATWNESCPTGTDVVLSVRSGNTPTPDATWTNFTALSAPGASVGAKARYVQYRADLKTNTPGNPCLLPVLNDVSFTKSEITAATVSDTTLADFQKGTAGTGIQLDDNGGGTIMLAPTAGSEFSGTALPSGWTSTAWNTGGASTVGGAWLQVDGAKASTTATYTAGRSLEFRATFQSDAYQHAGFATDLNAAPWAIFSTGSGGGLNVRTNNGTSNLSTPISSSYLGSPHTYRIDWNANNVTYYVDGVAVATHAVPISTAMRPIASDYTTGGNNLQVDYLRMGPNAASGSFTSQVFDAGSAATWDKATWNASTPTGTSVTIYVRTGNTATPDSTWTGFTALSGSGVSIGANARYLQYRADLKTNTPGDIASIPKLYDMTIGYLPTAMSLAMAASPMTLTQAQTAATSTATPNVLPTSATVAAKDLVMSQPGTLDLNVVNQYPAAKATQKSSKKTLSAETDDLDAILQQLAERHVGMNARSTVRKQLDKNLLEATV